MEDEYGMPPDLRQYIAARPDFFPPPQQPPPPGADLLSGHRGLTQTHPYDMLVFRPEDSAAAGVSSAVSDVAVGPSNGSGGGRYGGFDSGVGYGGAGRWPRQETLTLLGIRSMLDSKFKEANQKGPLWDEVSRIMSEEHGYQRSGKKCREKFENLYKYYKKTKEGKAGRQDGKHYRFFRQLEALYGDNNNNSSASASEAHYQPHPIGGNTSFPYDFPNKEPYPKFSDNTSLSLSTYSEPGTTSSDNTDGKNDNEPEKQKQAGKTGWKAKIKNFIDLQMKNLMEKQEAWMEKMIKTIEMKEQERLVREEEWRKQDTARIEREHQFWVGERAWIEARDAALMDALHKLTGKEFMAAADLQPENGAVRGEMWLQNEQQQRGFLPENVVLEETGGKIGGSSYLIKCGKKRKENWKSGFYGGEGVYCENGDPQGVEPVMRLNDQNHSSNAGNNNGSNDNIGNGNSVNVMSESCFRYFINGDGYGRIME